MGDFGIAPKTIMTKNDFSTNQRKRNYNEEKMIKEHERTSTLFLGPELLNSLVVPAKLALFVYIYFLFGSEPLISLVV